MNKWTTSSCFNPSFTHLPLLVINSQDSTLTVVTGSIFGCKKFRSIEVHLLSSPLFLKKKKTVCSILVESHLELGNTGGWDVMSHSPKGLQTVWDTNTSTDTLTSHLNTGPRLTSSSFSFAAGSSQTQSRGFNIIIIIINTSFLQIKPAVRLPISHMLLNWPWNPSAIETLKQPMSEVSWKTEVFFHCCHWLPKRVSASSIIQHLLSTEVYTQGGLWTWKKKHSHPAHLCLT